MMQLDLDGQAAMVTKVNVRSEQHGDKREPACDVKLEFDVQNEFLIRLDPTLRQFLFAKDPKAAADLADQGTEYSALRLPRLGVPLKWTEELIGAEVTITPKGERRSIELEGASVNAIELEPREGGTVTVTIRVQCKASEQQIGRLGVLDHQQVTLSIRESKSKT